VLSLLMDSPVDFTEPGLYANPLHRCRCIIRRFESVRIFFFFNKGSSQAKIRRNQNGRTALERMFCGMAVMQRLTKALFSCAFSLVYSTSRSCRLHSCSTSPIPSVALVNDHPFLIYLTLRVFFEIKFFDLYSTFFFSFQFQFQIIIIQSSKPRSMLHYYHNQNCISMHVQ